MTWLLTHPLRNRPPKYRLHRASGQAVSHVAGRDVYLGPHGSRASKTNYRKLIGEWRETAALPADPTPYDDIAVVELVAAFMRHAAVYYRKGGRPTGEAENFDKALRPLRARYGRTLARDFGPRALTTVRQDMIALGWGRKYVNNNVARVKHVFKWAAERELVPPAVWHGLQAVSGLRRGRSDARETEPVRPVPDVDIDAVLSCVPRTVADMIRVQRITGMRSGELVSMRTGDIDTTGAVWTYTPATHKTEHHDIARPIFLGPRAQAIVKPYLKSDLAAFLFSPAESEASRREEAHKRRRTSLEYGNRPGTNRKRRPKRPAGVCYTTASYRRAIARGCDQAFPPPVPLARRPKETLTAWLARLTPAQRAELAAWRRGYRWHPHRLRHNAATALRKQFGIEAARVVLGHRSPAVTELYAEIDATKARAIAARVG